MITTTIGDIGAGHIGDQIARLAVANGYQVEFSKSPESESLSGRVAELGLRAGAGTPVDAASAAGVCVVTISPHNHRPAAGDPLAGTVIIETSRCCGQGDGDVRDVDDTSPIEGRKRG